MPMAGGAAEELPRTILLRPLIRVLQGHPTISLLITFSLSHEISDNNRGYCIACWLLGPHTGRFSVHRHRLGL